MALIDGPYRPYCVYLLLFLYKYTLKITFSRLSFLFSSNKTVDLKSGSTYCTTKSGQNNKWHDSSLRPSKPSCLAAAAPEVGVDDQLDRVRGGRDGGEGEDAARRQEEFDEGHSDTRRRPGKDVC